MAIRKFRTVEDMKEPVWHEPGDPRLYLAIARVWDFGRRTVPRQFPRGVHRRRSIEELNQSVEMWSLADFERLTKESHSR